MFLFEAHKYVLYQDVKMPFASVSYEILLFATMDFSLLTIDFTSMKPETHILNRNNNSTKALYCRSA